MSIELVYPLPERPYPRCRFAENERVDVVHPIVGDDGFEVGHMADDGVVQYDCSGKPFPCASLSPPPAHSLDCAFRHACIIPPAGGRR